MYKQRSAIPVTSWSNPTRKHQIKTYNYIITIHFFVHHITFYKQYHNYKDMKMCKYHIFIRFWLVGAAGSFVLSSPSQWPMTSDLEEFPYQTLSITFCVCHILILVKEPVFLFTFWNNQSVKVVVNMFSSHIWRFCVFPKKYYKLTFERKHQRAPLLTRSITTSNWKTTTQGLL